MKLLTLKDGQQTQVSDDDFIYLSGFNWSFNKCGYVMRREKDRSIYMHIEIAKRAGIDCQNQVDHRDGSPLNNQIENLRAATNSQNCANSKISKSNTSGYKGVTRQKQNQKWLAQIMVNRERIHLGYYNTKEAAAFAYQLAAKKYFREFARY